MMLQIVTFLSVCFTLSHGAAIDIDSNIDDVQPKYTISQKLANEDVFRNAEVAIDPSMGVVEMIKEYGYPIEISEVPTPDGYLLIVHRIPYGRKSPAAPGKPVVFLQHGLLSSSVDWVVIGPEKGLAFMLADAGYDVWMGNARGTTHSRKHVTLNPSKGAFWDFSWHEIGQYDLPAMIDFALLTSGESALHYIGHSQGTTSFFVMASQRAEYNKKIRSMHALAPVAFMSRLVSPFIRLMAPFVNQMDWITSMMGIHEFLPSNAFMSMAGGALCRDEAITQAICTNSLFLIAGFNSDQMNATLLPLILANTPAGASTQQILHYGQEVNSAKFRQYDHGFFENKRRYGTYSPPNYDLKKITAPVALHYSDNDWLAHPKDVDELFKSLPNAIGKFRIPMASFNHLDFMWAINVDTLVYKKVLSLMERY